MPIYEYLCPSCHSRFELLLPMSQADAPAACPQCHNGAKRVLSVFASFSKGADGATTALGGGSPCSGCSVSSCPPSCKA